MNIIRSLQRTILLQIKEKGKRKNVVLIAKTKITDLQNPAMTRNVMKRNKPVQTPARPYVGAATSIKREEINPATT